MEKNRSVDEEYDKLPGLIKLLVPINIASLAIWIATLIASFFLKKAMLGWDFTISMFALYIFLGTMQAIGVLGQLHDKEKKK